MVLFLQRVTETETDIKTRPIKWLQYPMVSVSLCSMSSSYNSMQAILYLFQCRCRSLSILTRRSGSVQLDSLVTKEAHHLFVYFTMDAFVEMRVKCKVGIGGSRMFPSGTPTQVSWTKTRCEILKRWVCRGDRLLVAFFESANVWCHEWWNAHSCSRGIAFPDKLPYSWVSEVVSLFASDKLAKWSGTKAIIMIKEVELIQDLATVTEVPWWIRVKYELDCALSIKFNLKWKCKIISLLIKSILTSRAVSLSI